MRKKHEERFRFMSRYNLDYEFYPSFLSQMKKYNEKYKHLKNFKELKKEVINALKNSPRKYIPLNAHPLQGNMKGFWSISTGLNSNRDRIIYVIDDESNVIYLKSIGDHSVYESFAEYWKENNLI